MGNKSSKVEIVATDQLTQIFHRVLRKSFGRKPKQIEIQPEDLRDEESGVRQKLTHAHRETIRIVFKSKFFTTKLDEGQGRDEGQEAAHEKQMAKLNATNWQYLVQGFPSNMPPGGRLPGPRPLTDLECIQIGAAVSGIYRDWNATKHIDLEALGLKINLYSMASLNHQGEVKLLKKAISNDRNMRHRPMGSQKNAAIVLFKKA